VLREYIVSEAMAALGIPTTRALAAVRTGEHVVRGEPLPGAVFARVAASHLRVGTFQFFSARDDGEALAALCDYALARHFPEARGTGNDALALLERVVEAQADLVARWLGVGFVHGVMNTDNTSISGETIDYGPCAFLDEYHPRKTFSSIDRHGRYAFGNQPRIAQWNMARFAETLLPLVARERSEAVKLANERLERFADLHEAAYVGVMRTKLGLSLEEAEDMELLADLLERLAKSGVDFTVFFRRLCAAAEDAGVDAEIAAAFEEPASFHDWAQRWRSRLGRETASPAERAAAMRRANPAFIPRNHRIEEAIEAAVRQEDHEPFEILCRVLERPYEDQPELSYLAEPPRVEQRVRATFCGT
jgi:serine/tyrosine/threonine adenylyltransferase